MHQFKISLKEFIIIVMLALPIGLYFYISNSNKISYETVTRASNALAVNFCEDYKYDTKKLIFEGDIEFLTKKIDRKNVRIFNENSNIYRISIKSELDDINNLKEISKNILLDMDYIEKVNFQNAFKSIKLNCKSIATNVYKFIPFNRDDNVVQINNRYSKFHLLVLLLSPFLIIYLLYIAYRFINLNYFRG
jgi:hypothetical protein